MSEKKIIPHIRIPRSLLDDPIWEELTPIQQHVFNVILKNVCYFPRKFDDSGVLIDLEPGQMCVSIRRIQELCHASISKNDVERSIKKLILCQIVRQEVRHRKSIITIAHSDTYELIINAGETRSETNLRRSRDNFETQKKKDKKEIKKEEVLAQTASPLRNEITFSFESGKFEGIDAADAEKWKELFPAVDVRREVKLMQEWCLNNPTKSKSKKRWGQFIINWLTKNNENAINRSAWQQPKVVLGKEEALQRAENGKVYKNYECLHTAEGIAFIPQTGQALPVDFKFKDPGFVSQFDNFCRKIGIA